MDEKMVNLETVNPVNCATIEIVNVAYLATETNTSAIVNAINADIETAENVAFKVAVKCAMLCGETINGYTLAKSAQLSRKDVYSRVNRSKQALSRWIVALRYILENDLFDSFNTGKYAFSYDKIICIFKNDLHKNTNFSVLMGMSVTGLEELAKREKGASASVDATAETETETETATAPTLQDKNGVFTFSYNGAMYQVDINTLLAIATEVTLA